MKVRAELVFLILVQLWGLCHGNFDMDMLPPPNKLGGGGASAFFSGSKSPTLTKEERYLLKMEKFENRINEIKNHTDFLEKPGENLKKAMTLKLDPYEILKEQANKGIFLEVENLSKRVLGDPKVYTRCGWQDKIYGEAQDMSPSGKRDFPLPQQEEEHEVQLWQHLLASHDQCWKSSQSSWRQRAQNVPNMVYLGHWSWRKQV
eukprot:TRINITY_DN4955_c0_g1_i3.p1 TRINITY_DN4955_c0_g1~~TRINITY_DN4955_c0_g1_i3.p1  ORF type:complete len:204 (-),score=52.32 TRINITY_DN4955_c0_g1_i3:256-867(-)